MADQHFPLPAGVDDAVLNRGQLARAFGVSEPTVDRMIGDGLPVLAEGANGKAYQFQLSACWQWKCRRDADEAMRTEEAERSVQQMRLALVGGSGDGDSERSLPPKERAAIYEAEAKWMIAARERGELIPSRRVAELLEEVFGIIRDAVGSLPDRISREAGLSGRQIEKVIEAGDDMLDDARRRLTVELL